MKHEAVKTEIQERTMRAGEAAQTLGVGVQTLHYYEHAGLIRHPPRTTAGYRIYTPEIVERVRFIRKAQALGFSLNEIKEILELAETGTSPCGRVQKTLTEKLREVERRLAELRDFRNELSALVAQSQKSNSQKRSAQICSIVEEAPTPETASTNNFAARRKRRKQ